MSIGLGEIFKVFESQFGTGTFQGAQEISQKQGLSEADKAMLTMVKCFVQKKLAQQQLQIQYIFHVQTMRSNKPQLYHGKSWLEFEKFVQICESNFFLAYWSFDQNIDKIAYILGFLMDTPASK